MLRKYHTKQTLEDVKDVFLAELDYTREATMADTFRRMNRDVPGVVIPRVHHSLSTRRVLTAELIGGQTYKEFCETASQEARNQAGVTIWQFMFRSMLRYGILYADPHPGNYRFLGDGRVAFLDFGCVKVLPDELLDGMKRYMTAALDGNWDEFDRACVEVLGYDRDDEESWTLYRSYTIELLNPITSNALFQWSPEVAREAIAFLVRGQKKILLQDGKLPKMPKADSPAARLHLREPLAVGARVDHGRPPRTGALPSVDRAVGTRKTTARTDLEDLQVKRGEKPPGRQGRQDLVVFGAMGCAKHPSSCLSRSTPPSPSASAEVAKILLTELPPEDAGDADSTEAFIDLVRRDAWDDAKAAIDELPEDKKKKPSVRLVRGRVAMARAEYATALESFAGLEKGAVPRSRTIIEKWRAECQANVGPFPQAADYFAKQGGPKSLARAALAFDKAGMAAEARSAADKAIAAGKGDSGEVPVRMLRLRLAEAAGQRSVAAEDARFVVLRAPASSESQEAIAALERLDPGRPLTGKERLQRAERLVDAGRTDDAIEELQRAAKAPSPADEGDIAWARAFALYKARGSVREGGSAVRQARKQTRRAPSRSALLCRSLAIAR